jgi:hypothetical protein
MPRGSAAIYKVSLYACSRAYFLSITKYTSVSYKLRKEQGERDRRKQFKRDFFEEQHGFVGNVFQVGLYWCRHTAEFEVYFARRREAAIAREADVRAKRFKRKQCRKEDAAAAKALRLERCLSKAASAAARVLAAKLEKVLCPAVAADQAHLRSKEEHKALQEDRRIRKKAKRATSGIVKHVECMATMLAGQVIDKAVHQVAASVAQAGEVPVGSQFKLSSAFPLFSEERLPLPSSKSKVRRRRPQRRHGWSFC